MQSAHATLPCWNEEDNSSGTAKEDVPDVGEGTAAEDGDGNEGY